MKYNYKSVVLVVLDGFGIDTEAIESPWKSSQHPFLSEIEQFWPFTTIQASGIAVGLPWKEEGNSEVGHLTMGSGRVVYNHLPRIISAIEDGSFFQNEVLLKTIQHVKEKQSSLHLIGLFSSGSVHAYTEHFFALLDLAKQNEIKNVFLHLFSDGRDAPLYEGAVFFKDLEKQLVGEYPMAKMASLIGRYYAMDRDGNWDRVEKTYKLLTKGIGEKTQTAFLHLEEQYKKGLTDENIEPAVIAADASVASLSRIKDGDAVIFYNFREDSARELTRAFADKEFDKFPRKYLAGLFFATMTKYSKGSSVPAAFSPLDIKWPLAAVISQAGLPQLHIAEMEKYAHVTYFFNGGIEAPFEGEERMLVPSSLNIDFEKTPEMSAGKITEAVIDNLPRYNFILVNFANCDMVGHTGNFEASIKAIEVLDSSLAKIVPFALESGGAVIITADHGNVEEKRYKITGEKRTKHSANPVPFYLISKDWKREKAWSQEEIIEKYKKVEGTLIDVAPTILELLNLPEPVEMTGRSLLDKLLKK